MTAAAPQPPTPPTHVRCYSCAARQDPAAAACLRCGTTFAGMCACGTPHSLYASVCGGCGARLTPKRLPRSKLPAVRVARWCLAIAVVAGGVAALRPGPAEKPAHVWKSEGFEQAVAGHFAEAAKSFEAATHARPRDAEAWLSLASCRRRLGLAPDTYLPEARRAVELDPGVRAAQVFLAVCERDAGNLAVALEHAQRAAQLSSTDGAAECLVAELEISRPGGDVQAALAALRRAAAREPQDVRCRILTAECYLRLYGALPPESYPAEAAAAVDAARQAVADPGSWSGVGGGGLALAQLQLCAGAPADAYASATEALAAAGPASNGDLRARLLAVRGRAMLAWRDDRAAARADLVAALEADRGPETASSVALALSAIGRADLAVDVLTAAAERGDPLGSASAALVPILLRRGAVGPALDAARRAAAARPDDAAYALLLGDALRAGGDVAAARAAYDRARGSADGVAEARVALLALDELPDAEGDAGLVAALDSLASFLASPRPAAAVRMAAARLRIAMRDTPAAIALAARAAESAPGVPETWLLLAEAHFASSAADAAARGAAALQRARRLVPDDEDVCAAEADALISATDALGAVVAASRFLERHPDAVRMLSIRGRARALGGRWGEAAADLGRVVALDPSDTDAALRCAEAELRSGDRAAALRTIDGVDVRGNRAAADMVALLRLRIEGASLDQAAVRLRADGARAVLARVFLLLGRLGEASAEARAALVAVPGDPAAAEVLVHALLDANPGSADACAEADRALATIAASAPRSLVATLRARVLLAEGRWDEAYATIAPFREEIVHDAVARFVLGAAALRSGRTQEGLDAIRRAVETPGAPDTMRVAAADAFAGAAETTDAAQRERCARFALALSPDHPGASVRLAELLARRGDFSASAAVAEQGLTSPRATKEQALALRLLAASAETLTGSATLARFNLRRAAELAPDSPAVALLRGNVCLADGDLAGAAAAFDEVRAADPARAFAELGLITVEIRAGRADAAVARAKAWQTSHTGDTDLAIAAAEQFAHAGRIDAAAEVLRTAAALHPDDLFVAETLASALVTAGRHADAVELASGFAARRPHDDTPALLFSARIAAIRIETARDAIGITRRARAVASMTAAQTAASWAVEADARLRLHELKDADAAALVGIGFVETGGGVPDPSEPRLRFVRGVCAYDGGDLAGALREFERCVELAPGNTDYLNNLAWVLAKLPGRAADAVGFAIRAVKLRPREPGLWDTRAFAAETAGDLAEAERSRRTCLTLHAAAPSRDPDARARTALALARSLVARGEADEARRIAAEVAVWRPAPSRTLLSDAAALASE